MLDWIDSSVRNGDVVFDIGANIGLYSLYAALRHPASSVVSFEPEYSNLHLLRDNIAKNHLEGRVKVFSICLGNKTGPTTLHVQDLTPGAALHSESNKTMDVTHSGKPVIFREGVWSVTLDDFVSQSGLIPNCVKLDVDGTEGEILEGGQKTLGSQDLRTVIMEVAEDAITGPQCERLMIKAGFSQKLKIKGSGTSAVVWEKQLTGRPATRFAGEVLI